MKPSCDVMKLMLQYGGRPRVLIQIAGAGQPRDERAEQALVAAPEPPHVVAIAAVPFGPAQVAEASRPDTRRRHPTLRR